MTKFGDYYSICRVDEEGGPISMTFLDFDYPGNPHYSDEKGFFIFDAHSEGISESGDGKWEIWTVKPDGSGLKKITNNNFDDWGPCWSPNSEFIVYAGGGLNNSNYEIFYLHLQDGEKIRLTSH